MSIKDVTIVITSFKSDKIIGNCLNSIDRQYQVLLIENSNNLELKKNVERKFPPFLLKIFDFFLKSELKKKTKKKRRKTSRKKIKKKSKAYTLE